ncbi:MAG: HD domain-containing protein [Candidatus Aenigmarchaeota archaeon]|nr:HD domain-containing protein [Candidatus Aenigmarchaeota archaeon]
MKDLNEKVRKIIKKECTDWDWKYHMTPVLKYSRILAKKLGADEELVELGALLHDIGRIRHGPDNHHMTGIPEAEKILNKVDCPQKTISEIKHVVESHMGSGDILPKTLEAKIIMNADAMAHFDVIPAFMQVALRKFDGDLEKSFEWLDEKVERDWNNKLTLPEAKEMMREKYKAIRLLFDAMKEYI